MTWAACCFAYFGLHRISEFTTLSPDHFDSSTDLLLSYVALDGCICISYNHTNYSNNDQFRTGITICLGKTTHTVYPVNALIQYLAI